MGYYNKTSFSFTDTCTPCTPNIDYGAFSIRNLAQDLSGSLAGAGGIGGLISVTRNTSSTTEIFYPLCDGNGNISDYVDTNGNVVAHKEFDAHGNTIASSGNVNDFNFWFSTKYYDSETGMYQFNHRYYSPPQGRFTSKDPIEEEGGLLLYGYCRNDGVSDIDILGLSALSDVRKWITSAESLFNATITGKILQYNNVLSKLRLAASRLKSISYASSGDSTYDASTHVSIIGPRGVTTSYPGAPDITTVMADFRFGHELTHVYDDIFMKMSFSPLDNTEGHSFRYNNILFGAVTLLQLERLLSSSPNCGMCLSKSQKLWTSAWSFFDYSHNIKDVPTSVWLWWPPRYVTKIVTKPQTSSDHSTYVSAYGLDIKCSSIASAFNALNANRCCVEFACRQNDMGYLGAGGTILYAIGTGRILPSDLQ